MSQVQNLSQFGITNLKGTPTLGPQPNTKSVLFNPASATNPLNFCCAVKIFPNTTARQVVVDLAAPGDTCYGIVPFREKRQFYVPGENLQIFCRGNILWLEAAATVTAGDLVVVGTASASDGSAGVTTVVTATNRVDGIALTGGTIGTLICIEVAPGLHP